MNCRIIFSGLISVLLLTGCGAPRVLTSYKSEAEKAFETGNYGQAVNSWKLFFEQQTSAKVEILAEDYARAAKSAFAGGQSDLAIQWFDQARFGGYSDPEMYVHLATIYRNMDNLSKEITALDYYCFHFKTHKDSSIMRNRLFETCLEAEDYDKALELWKKMDLITKKKEQYLEAYFTINRKKGNAEVCDSATNQLLQINPAHTGALEWNAEKYYWLGENRYQLEIEKYNKNRTNRQYQLLLKELDLVTADFKKALIWFDLLWKKDPGEKYAAYLATIYARFGNPEKADYYKSFLKK